MTRCKQCKYWQQGHISNYILTIDEGSTLYGTCSNEKVFVYNEPSYNEDEVQIEPEPETVSNVLYGDHGQWCSGVVTGSDFGCIHSDIKEGIFSLDIPNTTLKAMYGLDRNGLFVSISDETNTEVLYVGEKRTFSIEWLTKKQSELIDEYLDRSELFKEKGIHPHPLIVDDIMEILITFGLPLDDPIVEIVENNIYNYIASML